MVDKAFKIFKKYKQTVSAKHYVNGFEPFYKDVFKELPKSDTLTIDIGCAYGIMALACRLRGDTVLATDMTDKLTNMKMLNDNGIPFELFNLEKDKLSKISRNSASLITFTETLEHLNSNPLHSIKKLYDILEEGGRIVCTTPAKELWLDTTTMNNGRKGLWNDLSSWRDIPEYSGKWKDEHTFHYDQFELVSLFTEAGFFIEDIFIIGDFSHLLIARKIGG